MEIKTVISNDSQEKRNLIQEVLEETRDKMEAETHIFIEATMQFALEWVKREMGARREVEITILSGNDETSPENSRYNNERLRGLNLDFKELPLRISDIVETHLNQNKYWIHRSTLPHAGISRDYLEFRKEKMRKEMASRVRVILGCASEVSGDLKEEGSENRLWVIEKGKRKYACFLRFSDEMTASLNRYLEKLEELFVLDHEMRKEMAKIDGKISEGKND